MALHTKAEKLSGTLKQNVYDALRSMILSGEVSPGEQMRERDLSERLGVSRTPLREALNQLEREGLVESQPHRGYFVPILDLKTAEELLDLRIMLDAYATGLAVDAISEQGLAELKTVMDRLAEFAAKPDLAIEELAEEVRVGMRIHEIVARESGHRFLYETLRQLYGRLSLLIWVDVLWVDKWDLTRAEHKEIVEAITARDKERAVTATRLHVQRSRDDLMRVVQAQSLLHGKSRGRLERP